MNAVRTLSIILLAGTALAADPATPAPTQKTFASPDEAVRALVDAAGKFDVEELKAIFGPDGVDLVITDDAVQSKNNATAFVEQAKIKTRIDRDPKSSKKRILVIGKEDWPAPIPLVQVSGGRWRFDTTAGREEILYRRIGQNELDAIQVCHGFVEAQQEYASEKRDGARIAQYAQRMISSPGKHDGLAWQEADGTWGGPVGEAVARAIAEGYGGDKAKPYHGYYYKVLKGQGSHAYFGAMDYVVKGAMIGGFALAASPATYRVTGVKTFIVNQDGTVYEKDLGEKGAGVFKTMTIFDPDKSWKPVADGAAPGR